jgi:hypothetical protein
VDQVDRTHGGLPHCTGCAGSSAVTVSEYPDPRRYGTVTMFRCQRCGYTTWEDRAGLQPLRPLRP